MQKRKNSMMKKIIGVTAMSALVFGMFACSGEDGADGINGKNGADGADGVSCLVKALKDKSGFKVVCDGDSVGVIKNGTDGKNGADGKDGKDGKDGEDGKDGTAATAKDGQPGQNGADCTAKETKDKNGFYIICGKDTVGTLTNGKAGKAATAEDGETCELEDDGEGSVTITCGESSTTLFKAMCGDQAFDPETQFCYNVGRLDARVGKRCKYRSGSSVDHSLSQYDPDLSFCDEKDTLRTLCNKVPYNPETEYCENNKVETYKLCADDSDVKYKPTSQYCYTTKGAEGIQVEAKPTCGDGEGKALFNPRVNFCKVTTGSSSLGKRKICGNTAAQNDTLNIDIRYNEGVDVKGNGEICDDRDDLYQVYKYVKIGTQTWMAQNLNYPYLKPTAGGAGVGLDSSSFCYDDDPANCEKFGRLYVWSAAIDSAALDAAGTVCGDGNQCTFTDDVQGVCPDGWHLPSKAEVEALATYDGNTINTISSKLKATTTWTTPGSDDYGFSALFVGYRYKSSYGKYYTSFWSSDNSFTKEAYGIFLYESDGNSNTGTIYKYYGLSVRCIKD